MNLPYKAIVVGLMTVGILVAAGAAIATYFEELSFFAPFKGKLWISALTFIVGFIVARIADKKRPHDPF